MAKRYYIAERALDQFDRRLERGGNIFWSRVAWVVWGCTFPLWGALWLIGWAAERFDKDRP
jgi:hypothetical protein